ncbi:hypothetical protein CVT25_013270 [Psilocybe cyanescens]|uniref:Uncharacterized protein n=1 Tax=Psilocybe cyanescens TaxID=93625 RepID=A0A409XK79_PSICY|nr:hypothetical protein CVT25_013270 [Psilocybe cyanescens]
MLRINEALKSIHAAGFPTFCDFLEDVLTPHNPSQSSQISQLLLNHGPHLFDLAQQRQPKITNNWIISSHRELVSVQCTALAEHFHPTHLSKVTDILSGFSLKQYLAESERVAPLICQIL